MTAARIPGSVAAAVFACLQELTPAEAEAGAGRSLKHLYDVANPGPRGRALTLDVAAGLEAARLRKGLAPAIAPLLDGLVRAALDRIGGAAPRPARDLDHHLRQLAREHGELAAAIDEASADGRLTLPELRRAAKEIDDVLRQARDAQATLAAMIETAGARPAPRAVAAAE